MSDKKKKPTTQTKKYYLPVTLPFIHMQKDPDMPYITETIKYGAGGVLKDIGKGMLNNLDEAQQVITGVDFYDPKMETNIGVGLSKATNLVGDITQTAAPTALNLVAPGLGTAVQATQTIGNELSGGDQTIDRHQVNDNTQNAIMGGLGVAGMALPFFTGNIGTETTGNGSASAINKYGGKYMYDNGGKYYTKDPNDPKLKQYQDSLKMKEYLNQYTSTLDSLANIKDPAARDTTMNKMWYNTSAASELNNLLSTSGLKLQKLNKPEIPGANSTYQYEDLPRIPEAVLLGEGEEIPAPKVEPQKPMVPVDPNWQYKAKKFTGFHDPSFQGTGYEVGKLDPDKKVLPAVTFEHGGPLHMTEFNGLPHEQGGIPLGQNSEVETGEVRVQDYIFSDSLTPEGSDKTFAELAKKIDKKYGIRNNDAMSDRAKIKELQGLMMANEEARMMQEQSENQMMESMVMKYGGCIKMQNGGYYIDPTKRASFVKDAKANNMGISDFATKLYNYGGRIKYQEGGDEDKKKLYPAQHGGDYVNTLTQNVMALGQSGLLNLQGYETMLENIRQGKYADVQGEIDNISLANQPKDAFGNPVTQFDKPQEMDLSQYDLPLTGFENYVGKDTPINNINNTDFSNYKSAASNTGLPNQQDFFDPTRNFGAKEVGYLASNLGPMYNLLKGRKPTTTEFERMNADLVDLSAQRDLAERQATQSRAISRGNIRNLANTSGQALSNLSANNSAISSNLQDILAQSYLNEETSNVGIKNQANQINTQIAMQEKIANEQNKAMADSITGLGLTDMGTNAQHYFRDKSAQWENSRYNNQLMQLADGRYFKWTTGEDGKLKMEFINLPTIQS